MAAGKPERPPELVKEIFETICKPCPFFRQQSFNTGRCGKCGCQLNLTRSFAKIRWATESCPDDLPRWAGYFEVEGMDADKAPPQKETRRQRQKRLRAQKQAASATKETAEQQKAVLESRRQAVRSQVSKPEVSTDNLILYSRDGRELGHALRDSWCNWHPSPAAFLVGSAPSLDSLDLSHLAERGVMSLGINNAAAVAPCRAMICSDPCEKFHSSIWLDASVKKFVPRTRLSDRIRMRNVETGELQYSAITARECPEVYGYRKDAHWRIDNFLTYDAATIGSAHGCPRWKARGSDPDDKLLFTLLAGLRLLHYLGIRTVYMIGVDFAMVPGRSFAWPDDPRWTKFIAANNRYYRYATEMLTELKPVFERAEFNVYNCNPNSQLRVFGYVPYEQAVQHCKSLMAKLLPPARDELSDWYIKDSDRDND